MKKVDVQNKDICTIYHMGRDGYGDYSILDSHQTKCLFLYGMSNSENNSVELTHTDAHSYLDVDDEWVLQNADDLEGMFYTINRYGKEKWYKIDRVKVGRTVLTENQDNCIHVFLSKSDKVVNN